MTRKELLLLCTLAAVQFSHIMDFMIMMPLGPQFMELFHISTQQFGTLVASYSLAAFVSNAAMSFITDRFDRKVALLVLFAAFLVGTFMCALANSFALLMAARIFTGFFGGLLSAVVFAIVGDVIPTERRATGMGIIMAGFSGAAVLGVPTGLYLAAKFSWHYPFLLIVALGVPLWVAIWALAPAMRSHLSTGRHGPFEILHHIATNRNRIRALALSGTLILGQFCVIPLIATYMVKNVGLSKEELASMYLVGGAVTLFAAPAVGRLADRYGKPRIFSIFCLLSTIPFFLMTHLGPSPIYIALMVSSLFFIMISGRSVPANTMVVSTVAPQYRGGFMNINSAVIQLGAGIASLICGLLVSELPDGRLVNFENAGYFAIVASIAALWLGMRIKPLEV